MEPETLDNEAYRLPPIKRLNGKIETKGTKEEEMAFTGGPHCEVWQGMLRKEGEYGNNGGETVGGGGVDVKVSLGLIACIPLKSFLSGSVESTSNDQNVKEDV